MSSEKTPRASRKEPRQLKELRSLLPWGWDARAVAHPPGKKTLRDFQECRKFLDPSTVSGPGSIGSSTRKRQKKDGKENSPVGQKPMPPLTASHPEGLVADAVCPSLSKDVQTPLVERKVSMQHSDAPASLAETPCTGLILATPMDQQSSVQRLAMNTLGSSVSTGLAFTPVLRATPIVEEAPRTVGMSESPAVPTKLVDVASPGVLDLPDITTHAENRPSAEGPHSDAIHGDSPKAGAGVQRTVSCSSDASAQLALPGPEMDCTEQRSGSEAEDLVGMDLSPLSAQAEPKERSAAGAVSPQSAQAGSEQMDIATVMSTPSAQAIPNKAPAQPEAAQMDIAPPAVQQTIQVSSPSWQQDVVPTSLPMSSLPQTQTPAALAIPSLDTSRVAGLSPSAGVSRVASISPSPAAIRPTSAQATARTCPPLFRPIDKTAAIPFASQKKQDVKVAGTVQAAPTSCSKQRSLSTSHEAPLQRLDISNLAIARYKEAVGDLWREKWGWAAPVPRSSEPKLPHQRACRLEARFLEGCRNLMRLQCDGDKSWQGLNRMH